MTDATWHDYDKISPRPRVSGERGDHHERGVWFLAAFALLLWLAARTMGWV